MKIEIKEYKQLGNIKLPIRIHKGLKLIADKERCSLPDLVRAILDEFIKNNK